MNIVHFADVHLGMTNFSRLDMASGLQTRVWDFLDALESMTNYIERAKPDLALFAGDAFKIRTPSPTLSMYLAEYIQRIADVCPLVMLVGNHDRLRGAQGRRHSIEIMSELKAAHQIQVVDCIKHLCVCLGDKQEFVNIITIPWLCDTTNLEVIKKMYDVYEEMGDIDEAEPIILLAHASIEGAWMNDSFTTSLDDEYVLPVDIFEDFDYAALGHLHKHQEVAKNAVYAGSLERVDWGERNDDKGFVHITIEDGKTSWKFVSIDPRPMVEVRVGKEDIKSIGNIDMEERAIVRVAIDADTKASEPAIIRAVKRQLDDIFMIDSIKVIKPETKRISRTDSYDGALTPAELLAVYVDDNIEDDNLADDVYYAGLLVMSEVEEKGYMYRGNFV